MAHASTKAQQASVTPIASLAPFVQQRAVLLTTYRRDGTPVGTAVHIAVEGDHAYVRTWETSGKIKRIRRNPEVEIAPATMSGKPTGPAIRARARLLNGPETAHVDRLIERKHPIVQKMLVNTIPRRLFGRAPAYIELRPSET